MLNVTDFVRKLVLGSVLDFSCESQDNGQEVVEVMRDAPARRPTLSIFFA